MRRCGPAGESTLGLRLTSHLVNDAEAREGAEAREDADDAMPDEPTPQVSRRRRDGGSGDDSGMGVDDSATDGGNGASGGGGKKARRGMKRAGGRTRQGIAATKARTATD